MAKSILISIKPRYVADILNHKKTIEVRKSFPKCDLPIDVYIYCTKDNKDYLYYDWNKDIYGTTSLEDLKNGWSRVCSSADRLRAYQDKNNILTNGHILAKFTLNRVDIILPFIVRQTKLGSAYELTEEKIMVCQKAQLTYDEYNAYLKCKVGYAWHIDNLVIFDKPKELKEFKVSKIINVTCNLTYLKSMHTIVRKPLTKAPQSWQFIESENENEIH